MELREALRTTGAVREFWPQPVPDEVLARVLDHARFAPSGGNRQGWRVVVAKDAAVRRALRDAYLPPWRSYLAQAGAGLVAFSPLNRPEDEKLAESAASAGGSAVSLGHFAEHLDEVPVLLALLVDLSLVTATDRDLDRLGIVGGASIYPFAWNLLLAARLEGLGGVMTTMAVRAEPELKELLGAPRELALAALVALGYPAQRPRRLTRRPVESFATVDRVGGAPFPR